MENEIPPYAILSHTWETEEVSFQEMTSNDPSISKREGYSKIKRCCEMAFSDGFEYAWADTCCIDKTSSSELSEAINSMYQWYEKAEVCYAYISDYPFGTYKGVPGVSFSQSKWFTRGWTLQELIAPSYVVFFNRDWEEIGTKSSLRDLISTITGVHVDALLGKKPDRYSVAQRMSWASKRQTTRTEDIAYCLMGLFSVNMPMLYGEGQRAFTRLQEAIMMRSTDHTLFAWKNTTGVNTGLLADSPSYFSKSSRIIRSSTTATKPFNITNKGIQLELPLTRDETTREWEALAVLDCQYVGDYETLIALRLRAYSGEADMFYVYSQERITTVAAEESTKGVLKQIYVMQPNVIKPVVVREYNRVLVDARGLNLDLQAVYPPPTDAVISFNIDFADERADRHKTIFGGLLFRDREMNGCVVVVQKQRYVIGARGVEVVVLEVAAVDVLKEVLEALEIANDPSLKGSGTRNASPDRLFWQHPRGKWWVSVGLKKKIVWGEKVLVVTIGEETV